MRPELQFVATGVVIRASSASVFVGSGPFAADVVASTDDGTVRGRHEKVGIVKKKQGFVITFPDVTIAVLAGLVEKKEVKEYGADVVILARKDEALVMGVRPKLAILRGTMYDARDLAVKTGVQVIAVQQRSIIDLFSYGALGEQKALSKFTEEK